MFSIDIPKQNEKITDLDIYVMNPGNGFCLRWNQNGILKKIIIHFFIIHMIYKKNYLKKIFLQHV